MDIRRTLDSRREESAVVLFVLVALAAIVLANSRDFPALHSIFDTAVFLLTAVIAYLLWDIGVAGGLSTSAWTDPGDPAQRPQGQRTVVRHRLADRRGVFDGVEPFFTTKGERGSGLGLAMVYGIAQRHGVDISIVSALGEGTAVRLTFPLTSPGAHSTASIRIQKIPRHTKILLIDDDPVLLTSLRETLVHDGHQVQTANGGKSGIEAFLDALKSGKPFPVVITDLGMPHVDGRAVTSAIKSAGWGQRLVATGDIPEGVVAVLSKPPKLADLRHGLAECTGERAGKVSG